MEGLMADNKEGRLVVDGINAMPEGCIAAIVALATPVDACRLAVVSKGFRSASDSDVVWKRFLQPDCEAIVARSNGGEELLAELQSKKQLYMNLANRYMLVDGGSKSFWLEKSNGKRSWMLSARSITIKSSCTPMHWRWSSMPKSRFLEVAELIKVRWLEISGTIKSSMLSPTTCYAAYLVFDFTDKAYGLHKIFEISVSRSGANTKKLNACLGRRPWRLCRWVEVEWEQERCYIFKEKLGFRKDGDLTHYPKGRGDGWYELKIGEFYIKEGEEDEVELAFVEVKDGNWKGGLIVEGIELRPL